MWRRLKSFQSQRHKQQPWNYKAARHYIIKLVQLTALVKKSQRQRGAGGEEGHLNQSLMVGNPCPGWGNMLRSLPLLQFQVEETSISSVTLAAGQVPNQAAALANKQPQHAELCQDKTSA